MKKLGDLLGKFTQIAENSTNVRETIASIVRGVGIPLKDSNGITIHGSTVRVKTTALGKNELFLKQKRLVDEFAKNPLTKNITRIV